MENNVVKINGVVTVEEKVSQKGNIYRAFFVTVNGVKVQLGFVGDREELALLKVGVKL